LESLKNNILVLLTFLLTVVLVNGLKDNGYKMVFSDGYLAIVLILTLVSVLWLAMTLLETNKRFESASTTIKDILKLNYRKVIMESEIEDVVNPVIDKNRVYLKSQLKRYSIWWSVLLVVFAVSFATGNWYFTKPENKNQNAELNKEVKVPVEPGTKSKQVNMEDKESNSD
jgi:Na+/melibiose symporter-like transporter